jgi:hypothetical protein
VALGHITFSRGKQFSSCQHCLCFLSLILAIPAYGVSSHTSSITVSKGGGEVRLSTPGLQRTLRITKSGVASVSLKAGGAELLRHV